MNKTTLKAKVTSALKSGITGKGAEIADLVSPNFTAGKLYEAYVLGIVCQRLRSQEGLRCTLVGGKKIVLKSSHGAINPAYPHIRVSRDGQHIGNIWTDVEFTSLSAHQQAKSLLSQGDFHEMDIALVVPHADPRPRPNQVMLLVECKNTGYQKSLLREILGVRRELSYLQATIPTHFAVWPRADVPANPPSCVAVFSSDAAVLNFQAPGAFFGIDFFHEPL